MDISKIKKEDFPKMKVWELCAYIRAANPGYKFCGYLPKKDALIAANAIYDEMHPVRQVIQSDAISWNKYFMELAKLSSRRSKDPKTKVGACIIDPITHKILSIGYNGFPTGMKEDMRIWNSDEKHKYVVHAEANAILNSNTSLDGAVLYVTMFPCNECAKLLAQKGIKKIIYLDDKFLEKDSGKSAMEIFINCGISVEKYKEI